ncbi:MAG: hypothetical protein E7223_05375 [Clostridiales bacterium]|nr:hypothetical protein [Clostridiales bacterium]MBQ3107294.1 hypothetical protein [Bacillota bacterium]
MSNSLKLILRTFLLILFMAVGAWLNTVIDRFAASTGDFNFLAHIALYLVYLGMGVLLGTMVNPRFTKNSNRAIYLVPILLFVAIGISPVLYAILPHLPLSGLFAYLGQFSYASWLFVGTFSQLAFR